MHPTTTPSLPPYNTMELHAIWASLPVELVSLLIERTDDLNTLQSWCTATAGCSELQAAAFRYRYRDVYLDINNLCQDPDTERKPKKKKKQKTEKKENVYAREAPMAKPNLSDYLLEVDAHTNQFPARYVGNIILNLQEWPNAARSAWMAIHGADPQWRYVRKEQSYPYAQDAEYTAKRLLSEATNLQSVEQRGPVDQSIFDAILTSAPPSCSTFAFIGDNPDTFFLQTGPGRGRSPPVPSSWATLSQRKTLSTLTFAEFELGEGPSFARAVRSLEQLEDLKITFKIGETPYGFSNFLIFCFLPPVKGDDQNDFMANIDEPQHPSKLPDTLRSLELSGGLSLV